MFKCTCCDQPASHETWRQIPVLTNSGKARLIFNHALWCGRDLVAYFKYLEEVGAEKPGVHRLQEDNYQPRAASSSAHVYDVWQDNPGLGPRHGS